MCLKSPRPVLDIPQKVKELVMVPVGESLLKGTPVRIPLSEMMCVPVGIKGLEESNRFLLAFCKVLDLDLHPSHTTDEAPWWYRPYKIKVTNDISLKIIGDVNTGKGNFIIAIASKCHKDISDLYIYARGDKKACRSIFLDVVKKAKRQMNATSEYFFSSEMPCPVDELEIEEYSGKNFSVSRSDKGVVVSFRVYALTESEAQMQALNRMLDFSAFVSLETNLYWDYTAIENDSSVTFTAKEQYEYYHPYIDQHPVIGKKLLWSEWGYRFVDEFIFIDRGPNYTSGYSCFISACRHIKEGLGQEGKLNEKIVLSMPTCAIGISPRDSRDKQAFMTLAMISYMSAIESATVIDSKEETCKECGAVKYGIGKRVKEVVGKYLGENLGECYKQLYNYRSKFLHAGFYPIKPRYPRNTPQLDPSTATGLEDTGFFSVKMGDYSSTLEIMNIREHTTYVLRCYYQEKFFGCSQFDVPEVDDSKQGLIPYFSKVFIMVRL